MRENVSQLEEINNTLYVYCVMYLREKLHGVYTVLMFSFLCVSLSTYLSLIRCFLSHERLR